MTDIPAANNLETLHYKDGDTDDIIKVIRQDEKSAGKGIEKFSQQFKSSNPYESCQKIHDFLVRNITYKEDPPGVQYVKTPARLWQDRQGDCKSYTLFVCGVLQNLQIPYLIRFVGYVKGRPVTHVYPVALIEGKEYPVDAVLSTIYGKNLCGYEQAAKVKRDFKMTKIASLSGITLQPGSEVAQKQRAARAEAPREFIPFSNLTEGQARLDLLSRQLKLIAAVDPDKAKAAREGLVMIQKAKRDLHKIGGGKVSGVVSPELYPLAQQIAQAQQLNYGAVQGQGKAFIGGPNTISIGTALQIYGYPSPATQMTFIQDVAQNRPYNAARAGAYTSIRYGYNTQYKVMGPEAYNAFRTAWHACQIVNNEVTAPGKTAEDFYQIIRGPVNTNWINDNYEDEIGCGVLYDFVSTSPFNINSLPSQVQIKQSAQNQYNLALARFSGLSTNNISLMARNGVIATATEQPEAIISKLVNNQAGIGEPISVIVAIITAIATAVAAIAGSVGKARELDAQRAAALNIDSIGPGQMFAPSDWGTPQGPPATTGGGSGAGSGAGAGTGSGSDSSSVLPLLALGGAALYFLNQK